MSIRNSLEAKNWTPMTQISGMKRPNWGLISSCHKIRRQMPQKRIWIRTKSCKNSKKTWPSKPCWISKKRRKKPVSWKPNKDKKSPNNKGFNTYLLSKRSMKSKSISKPPIKSSTDKSMALTRSCCHQQKRSPITTRSNCSSKSMERMWIWIKSIIILRVLRCRGWMSGCTKTATKNQEYPPLIVDRKAEIEAIPKRRQ